MNRLQKSSVNMLSSAAGYILPVAANFLAVPMLLAGLGEAGYGLQNLVGVVIGYLLLMDMALDIPITKFVAEDHARGDVSSQNRLLNTTLQLYLLIGLAGMLVIMAAADLLAQQVFTVSAEMLGQARYVFLLAGVGFLANVLLMWGRAVVNGMQRYDFTNAVSAAFNLLSIGIGLIAVYAGYGVVGYVLVRVSVSALSVLSFIPIIHYLLPHFELHWGIDRAMLTRVRDYFGSGVLMRMTSLLTTGLDRTLIGVWMGMAAVGVYAIPTLVVSSFGSLISTMLHFTFPLTSELYSTGQITKLQDIFVRASRFIAALASLVCIPLLIFGDVFLTLWVGPDVAVQAAGVLRWLVLSAFLGSLAVTLVNNLVVASGHIRQFTVYALIRAGVVSAGYVLLIPRLGIEGAALATLIANGIEWFFFVFAVRRYLNMGPLALAKAAYFKPMLLAAAMAILGFAARPFVTSWVSLAVVIAALELLYVSAGFRIGVFGDTEKRVLAGLWQVLAGQVKKIRGQPHSV